MEKRLAALALAGACGLAAAGTARADVIYDFRGTAAGQIAPFVATFDLTDAQVATGAFNLIAQGNGGISGFGPTFSGDVGGFNSLRFSADTVTHSYVYGFLHPINLAFDAAGDLTNVNVTWDGNNSDVRLTGTGGATTATFVEDDPYICNQPRGCTVSGAWTVTRTSSPVPEPASFALLGAGIIALGLARRRLQVPPV